MEKRRSDRRYRERSRRRSESDERDGRELRRHREERSHHKSKEIKLSPRSPRENAETGKKVENFKNSQKGTTEFYLRYYVGHMGKFGHEFLEFEFKPNGRLRYANNSQYKADTLIRKEVYVNDIILNELKRIVQES